MVNTKVNLCGIEIDNPVIPASGTFGFGYEFAELYDINCLGTALFHLGLENKRIAVISKNCYVCILHSIFSCS